MFTFSKNVDMLHWLTFSKIELALHAWNKSYFVMVYNSFYTLLDIIR